MFGFLRRAGASEEERVDVLEYLREVRPLMEALNQEYQAWMSAAAEGPRTLTMERDPDGQHAAVYLWRVGDPARNFVQREPTKAARRYYESFALCLEARGAAADAFKQAADLAAVRDPTSPLNEANRKLAEAEREHERARAALADLEARIVRR